jgi:hypothetical protein
MATANFCIVTARDLIKRKGSYFLHVDHVISLHGPGFRSIVTSSGSQKGGEIRLGEDGSAYKETVKEGLKILMVEDKKYRNEIKNIIAK